MSDSAEVRWSAHMLRRLFRSKQHLFYYLVKQYTMTTFLFNRTLVIYLKIDYLTFTSKDFKRFKNNLNVIFRVTKYDIRITFDS